MSGFFPVGGGGSGGVGAGVTTKLSSPQNAITFSGIGSGVQHLLFIGDLGTNRGGQAGGFVSIQFNGDTAAHYYEQRINADNAVLATLNSNANTSVLIDTTGGLGPANELLTPFMVWVPNIQGQISNKKLFLFDSGDPTPPTATQARQKYAWWQPTVLATSITSVSFDANFPGSGQLITGSMISMYTFS